MSLLLATVMAAAVFIVAMVLSALAAQGKRKFHSQVCPVAAFQACVINWA